MNLLEGAVFTLSDLDFEDIDASLVALTLEPSTLTLAKGTSGRLRAVTNGALRDERNFVAPGGGFIQHVALDPSGRYLYLTTMDGEAFWYTISQEDGSLGAGTAVRFQGLILPVFLALTP